MKIADILLHRYYFCRLFMFSWGTCTNYTFLITNKMLRFICKNYLIQLSRLELFSIFKIEKVCNVSYLRFYSKTLYFFNKNTEIRNIKSKFLKTWILDFKIRNPDFSVFRVIQIYNISLVHNIEMHGGTGLCRYAYGGTDRNNLTVLITKWLQFSLDKKNSKIIERFSKGREHNLKTN